MKNGGSNRCLAFEVDLCYELVRRDPGRRETRQRLLVRLIRSRLASDTDSVAENRLDACTTFKLAELLLYSDYYDEIMQRVSPGKTFEELKLASQTYSFEQCGKKRSARDDDGRTDAQKRVRLF